jgi:hypothetical protein
VDLIRNPLEEFTMKDNVSRRELTQQYKERKVLGGVYIIRNTVNNKLLINTTSDLQGSKNRFEFAQKTGSCIDLKLQKDWDIQKGAGFVFEVLEELEKGSTQTEPEFKADIKLLKEIWLEKLAAEIFY